MTRMIFVLLGVTLLAGFTTACNTSKGFGKDVEKVGEKIQEKAR
ncbi:MAG: entericidin A/B family lipoprotein [Opitutaceae bacterium]|nr:entericidin A/B family lipoprotein [Opitutaceae bacterium]